MCCVPDRTPVTADSSACVKMEYNDKDSSTFSILIHLIDFAIAVGDGDVSQTVVTTESGFYRWLGMSMP